MYGESEQFDPVPLRSDAGLRERFMDVRGIVPKAAGDIYSAVEPPSITSSEPVT